MRAKLFCHTGPMAGAKFDIIDQATIGKSRKNTIVIRAGIVSSRHARIFYDHDAGCFFIEDLGSRNGTRLDGNPIARKEKLTGLHVITFAKKLDFFFSLAADGESEDSHANGRNRNESRPSQLPSPDVKTARRKTDKALALATVVDDKPAESLFKVEARRNLKTAASAPKTEINGVPATRAIDETVLESPAAPPAVNGAGFRVQLQVEKLQLKFQLNEGANVIGRLPACEICLDDPSISRRHAVINLKHRRMVLIDLGSRNHTFVEDKPIARETEIGVGTAIRFGAVQATLALQNGFGND